MTSTYRKVRSELAEQHHDGGAMPCRFCGIQTPRDTLCNLGARCLSCYRAYSESLSAQPPIAYARDDRLRSWAWNLKARHESGERLTPVQIAAYKAALRSIADEEPA